jgi:hypothetical protein
MLGVPVDESTRVFYALLGNGYPGGDLVIAPADVIQCDVQYLSSIAQQLSRA